MPLYPDLEDSQGKRVLLKVDSGSGRNGRDLLNKARFRGVYLLSWPSKRHLRAAGDGYELWSHQVCRPLQPQKHRHGRFSAKKLMKLGPSTFGLIIYGGVYPISKVVCENAVDRAFNVKSNQHLWAEVGAVPFTMKCLENKKVGHDGTDRDDPNFDAFADVQSQNDYCTTQLTMMGYKGEMLRAQ